MAKRTISEVWLSKSPGRGDGVGGSGEFCLCHDEIYLIIPHKVL